MKGGWVMVVAAVAIVVLAFALPSREISNNDYKWLQRLDCYPDIKNDIAKAFDDDKVTENEFYSIIKKCNEQTEKEAAGAKSELKAEVLK